MPVNKKSPSQEDRQQFIKSASITDLNKYFKNLDNLANLKGGDYKKMYDEDVNFVLSNEGNDVPDHTQIGGFFTGIRARVSPDPLARVHLLKEGAYCPIVTQGYFMADDCRTRIMEMSYIKKIVDRANSGRLTGFFMAIIVRRFVELLFCCSSSWYKNELRREEIKDTALKIGNNPVLTQHAKDIMKPLLDIEPNMYISDYIELRKRMKAYNKTGPEYEKLKKEKNGLIEKYGADKLYSTKLIQYMIHQSIKDDDL